MLGILLYEGFELLYYTGKLGYTLTKGVYSITKYYVSSNSNDSSDNETNTIQDSSISNDKSSNNETYNLLLQKIEDLEKEQKKLYSYIEELKDIQTTT